jgi:hypothetical protein
MRANIVRQTLLCAGLGMIAVSAANADVLDIVTARSSVSTTLASSVAAQVSEDYANAYPNDSDPLVVGNTEDGGWYMSASVGANEVSDIRLKNTSADRADDRSGINGVEITSNWGTSIDVTAGYEVLNWLSVEVQTGLAWNTFRGVTGTYTDVVTLDLAGDASGDMYQIPFVANVVFDLPLGNSAEQGVGTLPGPLWNSYLTFFGGAGFQVNSYELDAGSLRASGTNATFRYQLGAALTTQIAYNISFGAFFRFSASTGMDMGDLTADLGFDPATTSLESESFYNTTVGLSLRIDF